MINLFIKQNWLEKSSEAALESFKSSLVDVLSSFPEDKHALNRWQITKISEGNEAYLLYDEQSLATLKYEDDALHIVSTQEEVPRYDDVMYAVRYVAQRLSLAVYSQEHANARLPQNSVLSLDHSYFKRDKSTREFFKKSNFTPRYAPEGMEKIDEDRQALTIYSPYYAEHKQDGSIHILNNTMLQFLLKKDNQQANKEFSYKVADSMDDFAKKYDFGLIPTHFYQNYGHSIKIINSTYFEVFQIRRKVFIDPYVWDFDDEHGYKYYQNIENGLHLMDKVRKDEDLDSAIKRILREELKVAEDYVGTRVWGIEFDRDREGILTPRLKMNVYVHGMNKKLKSNSHDWVSIA